MAQQPHNDDDPEKYRNPDMDTSADYGIEEVHGHHYDNKKQLWASVEFSDGVKQVAVANFYKNLYEKRAFLGPWLKYCVKHNKSDKFKKGEYDKRSYNSWVAEQEEDKSKDSKGKKKGRGKGGSGGKKGTDR